jgi:L-aminopeptidase/D-esterase-like protein
MRPGPENLLTDIAGLTVGNASDDRIKTGVTAILCDKPAVAAVHVMGGAPGTRETDLLAPENTVDRVDAIVFSGGSAFGLDAASGVQAWLREKGRGYKVGDHRIPIVPSAIVFDLANGGDKKWGRYSPYRELGYAAAEAAGKKFAIGTAGAGTGATVAGLKGGLGSASTRLPSGVTVAALATVNAIGSPVIGDSRHFWAAPFEHGKEFGGLGLPSPMPSDPGKVLLKYRDMIAAGANTTIAVVATDAELSKAEAKRIAVCAHDGFARALWPSHTPHDGDLVFCLATGAQPRPRETNDFIDLCALAASTVSRAIARAVYSASPAPGDIFPTWTEKFGKSG